MVFRGKDLAMLAEFGKTAAENSSWDLVNKGKIFSSKNRRMITLSSHSKIMIRLLLYLLFYGFVLTSTKIQTCVCDLCALPVCIF